MVVSRMPQRGTPDTIFIDSYLIVPANDRLGVVPVAPHLFVFYFGMASTIAHPVCQAAIVGAGDGGRRQTHTTASQGQEVFSISISSCLGRRKRFSEMAGSEEYGELSHRTLAVRAWTLSYFSSLSPRCIASYALPISCPCGAISAP